VFTRWRTLIAKSRPVHTQGLKRVRGCQGHASQRKWLPPAVILKEPIQNNHRIFNRKIHHRPRSETFATPLKRRAVVAWGKYLSINMTSPNRGYDEGAMYRMNRGPSSSPPPRLARGRVNTGTCFEFRISCLLTSRSTMCLTDTASHIRRSVLHNQICLSPSGGALTKTVGPEHLLASASGGGDGKGSP